MIHIIDNLLDDETNQRFEEIAKSVCLTKQPTMYTSPSMGVHYDEAENYDIGQHVFRFGKDSPTGLNEFFYEIVSHPTFAYAVRSKARARTKINFIPKPEVVSDEVRYVNPHVDTFRVGALSCVYYINDVDTGTLIYNEQHGQTFDKFTLQKYVEPRRNRCVIFPAKFFHSAGYPKQNERLILNMVFE